MAKRVYSKGDGNLTKNEESLLSTMFGGRYTSPGERRRIRRVPTAPGRREMAAFLGCAVSDLRLRRGWFDGDDDIRATRFQEFLREDCRILASCGRSRATHRLPCRGREAQAPWIDAVLFIEHEGLRLVVGVGPLDPLYYGDTSTVYDFITADSDSARATALFERFFLASSGGRRVYQSQRYGGIRLIDLATSTTFDDLVVPPALREAFLANTVGLLERREAYKANGVPLRRGLILCGPPGNGKTLACRALAASGKFTFFWVTPLSSDDFGPIFDKARAEAPSVVLFEDVDLTAGRRDECPGRLGELLNHMDGLIDADGLVVIATTNDVARLDAALSNRPNRFDVRLDFANPEAAERRAMLARFTRQQSVEANLEEWVARSEALSGAAMRELCFAAIKRAIEAGRLDAAGRAVLQAEDFAHGLARVQSLAPPSAPVGFNVPRTNGTGPP